MSWEHDLLHVELVMSWSHEMGTWHDVPWPWHVHVWHVMSEHGMSCHDCGIMSMYDMTWNLHERHAMGGFWAGRSGGGAFQHQKSCGINFNKFLHIVERPKWPAAVWCGSFLTVLRKKKQFHFLNLSGSPVSRILWLVNHWRALEFCRL